MFVGTRRTGGTPQRVQSPRLHPELVPCEVSFLTEFVGTIGLGGAGRGGTGGDAAALHGGSVIRGGGHDFTGTHGSILGSFR